MFFLSHLIYSFSVIYGNTQSLFYELFYELILNPKLELFFKHYLAKKCPIILPSPCFAVTSCRFIKNRAADVEASSRTCRSHI